MNKFSVGQEVRYTNSNGVKINGIKTITRIEDGRYFFTPTDTPWYSVREEELQDANPPRSLTCCCCGESTIGRQWYNRDTGFGLCAKCAAWIATRENEETMKQNYGIKGVHYEVVS